MLEEDRRLALQDSPDFEALDVRLRVHSTATRQALIMEGGHKGTCDWCGVTLTRQEPCGFEGRRLQIFLCPPSII